MLTASASGDFAFGSDRNVRPSSNDFARLVNASGSEAVALVEEDMVAILKVRCLNVKPA